MSKNNKRTKKKMKIEKGKKKDVCQKNAKMQNQIMRTRGGL